jgi:dihydroorotate dehydrogenase (fumarate)
LFEEQIQIEEQRFDEGLTRYDNVFAEAVQLFPKQDPGGPKEHLYWLEKARKEVKMPIFASLNCINKETWVEYAKRLANTGVDGLELNFYSPNINIEVSANDIENSEVDILTNVLSTVKIPVSVKLHPYYTNFTRHAAALDNAGAKGFVLFNRLFQPDINVEQEARHASVNLSNSHDALVALRWAALLHDRLRADVVAAGGIETGLDVVKMILAGAKSVQVVSTLYRHSAAHLARMNAEIATWMNEHKYTTIEEFRGKAGKKRGSDMWSFERGQYIKAILGFD